MEDYKRNIQEANGYLRKAQNCMFSGKNEEAVELLSKADDIGSFAKQQSPEDFQVKSLFQKIEKMRKDLERKGVASRPGGNNEVPFEVQAQLNRIRDHIVKKELNWAKKELDVFYSKFAGPMCELSEINEFKTHIKKLEEERLQAEEQNKEAAAKAEEAKKQDKLFCDAWEIKFKSIPYFDGTPRNAKALLEEKEFFQKASYALNEFEKENFSGQLTIALESLMKDLKVRTHLFPGRLKETLREMSDEITANIEERIGFLNNDMDWKNDSDKKPYVISKRELDTFLESIEELKPLFNGNISDFDPTLNAYQQLCEINQQRSQERSSKTSIKPEAVSTEEAAEPTKSAIESLLKKYPDAKSLKTSMIRNWESKKIEEWADSTKTQWIARDFNETTVQVAAELNDGTCKLFTINVEKDKNSDGSFGQIRSHIMFEELMAKETIA